MTNQELEVIQNIFQFQMQIKSEWGSNLSNHRELIHQAVANNPTNLKYSSISHCPGLSGYVLANRPIGFDIEEENRLHCELIQRISTENERQLFDEAQISTNFIWTIKEAAFKKINPHNPNVKTISHIQIDHVQTQTQTQIQTQNQNQILIQFKLRNDNSYGICFELQKENKKYLLAIAGLDTN